MIVIQNEKNKLIPTRIITRQIMCIDYKRLSQAIIKDHFPLPFMDQMLERLVGHTFKIFLDGYSSYNQITVNLRIMKKLHSHAFLVYLLIEECHLDYAML